MFFVNAITYNKDLENFGIISIEVDAMKQEVSTQDIKVTIASSGKIALYGILFNSGYPTIR
jgi:hypothetical protein